MEGRKCKSIIEEEHHTVTELEDKWAGEGMRTSTHVTFWNMQVIQNGARTTCDTVSAIRGERSIVVDMQEGVL